MFRITAYAERLLAGLADLDWPDATKAKQAAMDRAQRGSRVRLRARAQASAASSALRIFTTRPDTLFGATYMVVAPEHPLVDALLATGAPEADAAALRAYVERARNRTDLERQSDKDKTGVLSGAYAINPATGHKIPIWIADYVLMGYGHGAIMAVPAHDERDFEFAEAFGLPIVQVVEPLGGGARDACYSEPGRSINSKNASLTLDGLETAAAKERIIAWLEQRGIGRRHVNYKLRDWLFSRQRYWGEPFPIVYDARGDHHAVSRRRAAGEAARAGGLQARRERRRPSRCSPRPLEWVHTTAGEAGVRELARRTRGSRARPTPCRTGPARAGTTCASAIRRTATRLVGAQAERYWMGERGVDLYIGGAEHAVLHLLYARFWHQVLYDLGQVTSPEPFRRLFHQGMLTAYAYQRGDKTLVPTDQVQSDR